jgi:hypothetical protein
MDSSVQNWLHLVHVLSAMMWLGGGVILCAIGLWVRRSADVTRSDSPIAFSEANWDLRLFKARTSVRDRSPRPGTAVQGQRSL